jgi:hypothetical protein
MSIRCRPQRRGTVAPTHPVDELIKTLLNGKVDISEALLIEYKRLIMRGSGLGLRRDRTPTSPSTAADEDIPK